MHMPHYSEASKNPLKIFFLKITVDICSFGVKTTPDIKNQASAISGRASCNKGLNNVSLKLTIVGYRVSLNCQS